MTSDARRTDEPARGDLADELRTSIQEFEPATDTGQAQRSEGLAQLEDLYEFRAFRQLEVREGLTPIVWFALIAEVVITVAFIYLVGMKSSLMHMPAVAALTAIVTFIIYTIAVLDYPFNGDLRVGPQAFELALREIEGD